MSTARRVLACCAAALSMSAALGPLAPVGSAQVLAKEQCDELKAEQAKPAARKLKEALEKGPDWAKANLSAAEFAAMGSFIEQEERWLFRCPQPKPQKAAATKEPAATDVVEDDDKPAAKAGKAVEKKAEKKAAPAKKTADGTAKPAAEPAAKPKPVPSASPAQKPQKSDAYVPPRKPAVDN